LWTGSSGKNGTLTLTQSITRFSELVIDAVEMRFNTLKRFRIRPETGDVLLDFVSLNFSSGAFAVNGVLITVADTTITIIGQRLSGIKDSTGDLQCLNLTKITGLR
jgi:hypothetical protein